MIIRAVLETGLLDIVLAAALGGVIGVERRWRRHVAGPQVAALLAIGSCLFVTFAFRAQPQGDVVRAIGQVAVGVGFLCGGAILRNGMMVLGLNTAATLWCVAAVGALCGGGMYLTAIAATGVVLVSNLVLHVVEHRVEAMREVEETDRDPKA